MQESCWVSARSQTSCPWEDTELPSLRGPTPFICPAREQCPGATLKLTQSFSRGWVSSKPSAFLGFCQGCTPAAMPRLEHTQHHETAQQRPRGMFLRLGMALCTSARAGSPGDGDGTTKQMLSPWPPPSPSWRNQEPGKAHRSLLPWPRCSTATDGL